MKTLTIEAKTTMNAISRTFFNGTNYSDTLFYEYDAVEEDGSATGTVFETIQKGVSKEIGEFHVAPNGEIKKFPGIPQSFIEEINQAFYPTEEVELSEHTEEQLPEEPLSPLEAEVAALEELDADTVKRLAEKYEVSGQTVRNKFKKLKG